MTPHRTLLLCVLTVAATAGRAQGAAPEGAPHPEALAQLVLDRFVEGDPRAFAAVYPFERGRGLHAWAVKNGVAREGDLARALTVRGDSALVALGAQAGLGHTGDETVFARGFSGLYVAARGDDGAWRLARRVPSGATGRIAGQRLDVEVRPGWGLVVSDTLRVVTEGSDGFATHLNHAAERLSVTRRGVPVRTAVGGGLLWLDLPPGDAEVVVRYRLDVAQDSAGGANTARFEPHAGHVRNQHVWHPFTEFGDASDFSVRVRAPADVHVATDLVQTEHVADGVRTVEARTEAPTDALSLFYDRGWVPTVHEAGGFTLALYATPDVDPAPDVIRESFERTVGLLVPLFGRPPAAYIGVVQQRARPDGGWKYRSNHVMATGASGGAPSQGLPRPRAYFDHEVAHGWVSPTGEARNLLGEGWATYAEGLVLRERYGPEAEAAFWEGYRNAYHRSGFEGAASLLDDDNNSGIAYSKGAWVFRFLASALGEDAFHRGLRLFFERGADGPADYALFVEALSEASGKDVGGLLEPWARAATIPDVRARPDGDGVVLEQAGGPVFDLPLDLDLETSSGRVRRGVRLRERSERFAFPDLGAISAVRVDPDRHVLRRRHRGEVVRFATGAPGAESVGLSLPASDEPIPAVREGDEWVVEVPLTEGRYPWRWIVDGEPQELQPAREVAPEVELSDDAYPC